MLMPTMEITTKNVEHLTSLIKSNSEKLEKQKLELIELEGKLTRIKLLQQKAVIIANEKKSRLQEMKQVLDKCHENFVQTLKPHLEVNLNKDIHAEVSRRETVLNRKIEDLKTVLLKKENVKNKYEEELAKLQPQILLQKRKRNVLHSQLQKNLNESRRCLMEAENLLSRIKKGLPGKWTSATIN